jgi:hypothetical protein
MIMSGEKTEEYRDIKDYWARRLLDPKHDIEAGVWKEMIEDMQDPFNWHESVQRLLGYFDVSFREYDVVRLRGGYQKDAPVGMVEFAGLDIKQGREEWGAEPGKFYFAISLGEILKN